MAGQTSGQGNSNYQPLNTKPDLYQTNSIRVNDRFWLPIFWNRILCIRKIHPLFMIASCGNIRSKYNLHMKVQFKACLFRELISLKSSMSSHQTAVVSLQRHPTQQTEMDKTRFTKWRNIKKQITTSNICRFYEKIKCLRKHFHFIFSSTKHGHRKPLWSISKIQLNEKSNKRNWTQT